MKNFKYTLLLIVTVIVFNSCKKDDPTESTEVDSFIMKIDGEEVVEGTTLIKEYNVVGEEGELGFHITNQKDEPIILRATISSNDVGANMEFCFASCSANINDEFTEVKTIPVGHTTTTAETHIFNNQDGSRDYECTVKINEIDESGNNVANGKALFFTYKYVAP